MIDTSSPPPRRRWFRFWLRTFLVLLVLIGAWLGWELHLAAERQRALAWLTQHNVAVKFSEVAVPVWQRPLARVFRNQAGGDLVHPLVFADLSTTAEDELPTALQCVRTLDCVGSLAIRHCRLREEAITELARCSHVKELILTGTDASNDMLKALTVLSQLEALHLEQTAVSDAGLRHLRAFVHLAQLDLSDTSVTDQGLKEIGKLIALQWLILHGTQITSAGMPSLATLPALVDLDVSSTRVDEAGVRAALQIPTLETLGILSTGVAPAAVPKLEQDYPKVFFY